MVNSNEDTAISELISVRKLISSLKEKEAELTSVVLEFIKADIDAKLSTKDYGCGTAHIGNLKVEVKKSVKYDQEGLKNLYQQISDAGKNPLEYINVKYDISESKYKAWPSDIQKAFEPYRTVKPSAPSITVVEEE